MIVFISINSNNKSLQIRVNSNNKCTTEYNPQVTYMTVPDTLTETKKSHAMIDRYSSTQTGVFFSKKALIPISRSRLPNRP